MDASGNLLEEVDALGLPDGARFSISWGDGAEVECSSNGNGSWTIGFRRDGQFHHYGAVERDGDMYRAVGIVYSTPQESFAAAARKYY